MRKITCTHKADEVSFIIYIKETKFNYLMALGPTALNESLKQIAAALAAGKFTGAESCPKYYISQIRRTENPDRYSLSYVSNDNVEHYDNNYKIDLADPGNADFDIKLEETNVSAGETDWILNEIARDKILLARILDQDRRDAENCPDETPAKPVFKEMLQAVDGSQDVQIFSEMDWYPYYQQVQDAAESYRSQQLEPIVQASAAIHDEIGRLRNDAGTEIADLADFVEGEISKLNLDSLGKTVDEIVTAERIRCDKTKEAYFNNYRDAHRPLPYLTQLLAWYLYEAARKYWANFLSTNPGDKEKKKKKISFEKKFRCVGIQLTEKYQLSDIQHVYNVFDEAQLYKAQLAYNSRPDDKEIEPHKLYLYCTDGSLEYAVKKLARKTIYGTQLRYDIEPDDNDIAYNTVYLYQIDGSLAYAVKDQLGKVGRYIIKPDDLGESFGDIKKVLSDHHKKPPLNEKQKKAVEALYAKHLYFHFPNVIERKKITPEELGNQFEGIKKVLENPDKNNSLTEKQKEAFQALTAKKGYYQNILDKSQTLISRLLKNVATSPLAKALKSVREELYAFDAECRESSIFGKYTKESLFTFSTLITRNFAWNKNAMELEKQVCKESDAALAQPDCIDARDTDLERARTAIANVKSRLSGSTMTPSLREKIEARKQALTKRIVAAQAAQKAQPLIPPAKTEDIAPQQDPAIAACKQLAGIISDLDYWHGKVTWWGGDEARLGGRELRVPKGIALMIEKIKLHHTYGTDARQARILLAAFQQIAIDSRGRSQNNFVKYSIFNIRNPRLDRFYDCLRSDVNVNLMGKIRKWEDTCMPEARDNRQETRQKSNVAGF